MTKKEIQGIVEGIVEEIAVAHGAEIGTVKIKVGGRLTDSKVAEGGLFDLDACRGLLARALEANREALIGFFATTQPKAVSAAYELQKQPS
jgi:hypothetical protein